ncbi:murein hydrolase activator EnvC family protein [Urechidicola vernalis]|uniref:Peptidoglycan DD-metalloendopeptidase family protein n=1 Tax=Urechidicola vernalis TaxID=3075600 RepID=A0ABU2Y7K4_9FLAO|nr:peptidoglycan DD-metalloendopeptidase family protein [Urechidicola sp. P050]MDT0554178.1 peptidoglycan DD-metalloendopeptidase family protein [Urechidicola sp. P050]
MNRIKPLLVIALFLFSGSFYAQETRAELEAKRKEIQAEKDKINILLSQAISEEKSYLSHLNEINLKIDIQQKLIDAFTKETNALNKEIRSNQNELSALKAELKKLKKEYGEMIYKSYKSKSQQSRLMFVLSSDNFYQAFKRLQYMKQYADFRKNQGYQISEKADELEILNDTLEVQKKEKQKLSDKSKNEQDKLKEKKKIQDDLIAKIKKDERKYRNEIKKKQKEQGKINAKIEKIIRDEIVKSNVKAGKNTSGFVLTAETKLLAIEFEGNKGKLPWPVERGFVSRRFGKQKHPTLAGIYVQSAGVRITTEKGSNARAVFDGTVMMVQVTSGNRKAVYVQHGNYISIYNNLETVFVKKGDQVSTKQLIGKIYTDKITNKTILRFQIWKNTTKLNPASWVYKM